MNLFNYTNGIKKVILFGANENEKSLTKYFIEKLEQPVSYLIDNDKNKSGKIIHNKYSVFPVEHILKEEIGSIFIVIATEEHHEEMRNQLIELGFIENQDFIVGISLKEYTNFEYRYWKYVKEENGIAYPSVLRVELSGICNLKCTFCPFHGVANLKQGHKKLMSEDILKTIAEQAKKIKTLEWIDTTGAGEIFVNKNWFNMLKYLQKETNITKLIIYTNGMLLNQENVDKLCELDIDEMRLEISIDGESPEENNLYRFGSNYELIKNNLDYAMKKLKNNIQVYIGNCRFLSKEELAQSGYTLNYYQEAAEYIRRDFPEVNHFSTTIALYVDPKTLPEIPEYQFIHIRQNDSPLVCLNLFKYISIDCEGNVVKCSCGAAGCKTVGNIMDDNMLNIWLSHNEMSSARTMMKRGISPDFCYNCPANIEKHYDIVCRK